MLSDIAHQRGQALLRQRKILLVAAAASLLTNLALGVGAEHPRP